MCPFVYGHMPVFSSDFANKDVTGKSWALYETIDAGEEILLGLNIQAHENLSFSVNIPYSETFEENVTTLMYLTGHNASQIDCDPKFDGWRVLSFARSVQLLIRQNYSYNKVRRTSAL